MISYLKGTLSEKNPVFVSVECCGVGYEVQIPLSTFDKLPQVGEEIKLNIHYSFNEMDGVRLFGFFTVEERELFRNLISVSKVGPKIALTILSGLSVKDFLQAVASSDVSLLSTIPGIGKKSAERLIIELKDKVGQISSADLLKSSATEDENIIYEAESGLLTLGYKVYEIRKALKQILSKEEIISSEDLIKAAIRLLYSKKNI
jgi:Holliday junction DNA helicase RuvA